MIHYIQSLADMLVESLRILRLYHLVLLQYSLSVHRHFQVTFQFFQSARIILALDSSNKFLDVDRNVQRLSLTSLGDTQHS